ncbi:class I SAM-dependent methyltransferase [Nonomuraea sp. LPB2021202275-12-8]|uniref:class I SAM-dependent methyltransferase n=1 Tax=Nonomuraea sp. LPB2021202275-12-8 TaxID=3120159 RepID=UPI00300C5FAB
MNRPPARAAIEVMRGYYDAIAGSRSMFAFLSPVRLHGWVADAAAWAGQAAHVAEIGVGQGELAARAVAQSQGIQTYDAIDISAAMLEATRQRMSPLRISTTVRFHQLDIADTAACRTLGLDRFTRMMAINVIQDVDAISALANIRRMLQPGGLLRATVIRRETQDRFWLDDDAYDSTTGQLYTSSTMHDLLGLPPLGLRHSGHAEKAFYRVQQFYTEVETRELFNAAGLTIVSMSVIEFPVEFVRQRWSSSLHRIALTSRQESLLEEWGGYPDAYDVVAMRPRVGPERATPVG